MHPITTSYLTSNLGNIWSSVKILPEFAWSLPLGLKEKVTDKNDIWHQENSWFFARKKTAVVIISSLFLDAAGIGMDRYLW